MALKTFVKISTVNNLSDARYCAGMYVNLMGFNLEKENKDYMPPQKFKELTEWLSGLEYVAEFEASHPENILNILKEYEGVDYIQTPEEVHLQMLVNSSYKLIWKNLVKSVEDLQYLLTKAPSLKENDVILLIESENLKLDRETTQIIQEIADKCDVLLGFGLEADQIEETLESTSVKGIALKGGDEIKPGYKDFDELADILEALEEAD
ncbi:phosphoribosylanthranilate isomerase [Echinicola jeungdonensis]|uniref:Phosphoribosylanthranilate isomerase n=1 Tax=Echinicola jeungdonensis TaxID=709343 RepID=A0ABV5J6D5_9BACT|nr:phosphoribosylanthranilate isomerase [Echinicola jeungdonensis]MDN3670873.1 phosphoribosylanthranilate isomerase [Echinicola jeungdonensis]